MKSFPGFCCNFSTTVSSQVVGRLRLICNHLQALASLLSRGYEQYYVNFIPVKLFAFSRVFQDRLSGCTFLISAHNQFKPMGRVRNTESHSEKKGYSIFTFKRISVGLTSKIIHGKLIYWEMIQNFFERNLVDLKAGKFLWVQLAWVSMKIRSVRRALPMFCSNLFQSGNKPFTSYWGRNTLMNISWFLHFLSLKNVLTCIFYFAAKKGIFWHIAFNKG